MNNIHAHEVLRMMEGNSYSEESLNGAIKARFGDDARFHTCSAENLTSIEIIEFLTKKGKFKPTEDGFTMDITKVCTTY